ncbi:hypothetical protein Droror1_Dr00012031 [Drosera rotundifolia]
MFFKPYVYGYDDIYAFLTNQTNHPASPLIPLLIQSSQPSRINPITTIHPLIITQPPHCRLPASPLPSRRCRRRKYRRSLVPLRDTVCARRRGVWERQGEKVEAGREEKGRRGENGKYEESNRRMRRGVWAEEGCVEDSLASEER